MIWCFQEAPGSTIFRISCTLIMHIISQLRAKEAPEAPFFLFYCRIDVLSPLFGLQQFGQRYVPLRGITEGRFITIGTRVILYPSKVFRHKDNCFLHIVQEKKQQQAICYYKGQKTEEAETVDEANELQSEDEKNSGCFPTRVLVMRTLRNMGCTPVVGERGNICFDYQGEHFFIAAKKRQ